jgi:hypothetical protein
VGVVRVASVKVVVEVTSTVVRSRVGMAATGRGTMPMGTMPATVKLPAEPVVPQAPAVVLVVPPTVTDVTIPWVSAGMIVTTLAASAPEERVPRALTWPPTQTLAKVADAGGVRAASVKAVVGVTSTVVRRCRAAVATGRAQKPPTVKAPAEPPVPQEPAVVLVVPPSTVTDVTVPWAWAGTIVTKVAASAPEERVPRAVTWLPTQT